MVLLVFLLFHVNFLLAVEDPPDISTLKLVQAIWRHGDRTPCFFIPTDKENSFETWPEGRCQLTELGVNQHYELGKYLKQRYDGFLPANYSAREMHVKSSSKSRTIMSALSNLAGMYPPSGSDVWNQDVNWRPIPVHSIPENFDPYISEDLECPTLTRLSNEVYESEQIKNIENQNKDFLKFLGDKSGLGTMRFHEVFKVADPLICQKFHNRKWPSWMDQKTFERIVSLHNLEVKYIYSTTEIQKLRGSMLLQEVAGQMRDKGKIAKKYYAYSGHDTTILALLANLGIVEEMWPPYACIILIEVHERGNERFVEIYKRNGTTKNDFHKLKIANCEPCTVTKFQALAKAKNSPDTLCKWREACGLKEPDCTICPGCPVKSSSIRFLASKLVIAYSVGFSKFLLR